MEASHTYTKDVIGWHKRYERFVVDFINAHRYIESRHYMQLNAHAEALGIIEALLNERKDLASMLFAKPTLNNEDVQNAIFMFNTNASPVTSTKATRLILGSTLTAEQIPFIRECIMKNAMLNEPYLTDTLLQDWFSCKAGIKLHSKYLTGIVVLLDSLEEAHYIGYGWKHVIERNQMLLPFSGETPLKAKTLSSSLTQSKNSHSAKLQTIRADLKTLHKQLHEIETKGKNINQGQPKT